MYSFISIVMFSILALLFFMLFIRIGYIFLCKRGRYSTAITFIVLFINVIVRFFTIFPFTQKHVFALYTSKNEALFAFSGIISYSALAITIGILLAIVIGYFKR